jgi:hypothetical protein
MAKALAHRTGSLSAANPANANPGPKDPFAAGTQLQLQQKIRTEQEKVEKLTAQKVALAERLQALALKAAGRVEADLMRVRIASGELPAPHIPIPEPPSELPPFTIPTTLQIPAASPATIARTLPPTAVGAHEPRMPAPAAPVDINIQLQNKRTLLFFPPLASLVNWFHRAPHDGWCFYPDHEQPFLFAASTRSHSSHASHASTLCSSPTKRGIRRRGHGRPGRGDRRGRNRV